MIDLVFGWISFSVLSVFLFFCLDFGCSAVFCCCCCSGLFVVVRCCCCCWLLLLLLLFCCCFCYYVGVLLLLLLLFVFLFVFVCCFVLVVLLLSLLFLLFVCPRTTQQINPKNNKNPCFILLFALCPWQGFAQREANNPKQKTKGLFHSSFVFHPCCVSFFLCFIFS